MNELIWDKWGENATTTAASGATAYISQNHGARDRVPKYSLHVGGETICTRATLKTIQVELSRV